LKPILSFICLLAAIHAPSYAQSGVVAGAAPAPADPAGDLADPAIWPDWKTREIALIKKLFGPQAIVATVPPALADQVREFPKEWEPHWDGFGKRAASEYGQYILYSGIESAVQTIHKEHLLEWICSANEQPLIVRDCARLEQLHRREGRGCA